MNADGSDKQRLAQLVAGVQIFRPSWSPDGTKIVFTNGSDVFVMNPDGSGVTNITNRPDAYEWSISPSWQPVPLAAPGGNPIDDPQFFVRQHYLDFLSHEPEHSGLNAWLRVLDDCPAGDLKCLHQARLTTSASFFGSPEFQLKGYFVFRFYKVAFGRLPEYSEIAPDMRSVTGQTPTEVYTRKAAFADSFAQRPEFTNSFGVLANADYVTALLNRYQLTSITPPDPADPDGPARVALTGSDLLGRLDAGVLTRAQVLRAVADSDEVFQAEYNRAFVAMQ